MAEITIEYCVPCGLLHPALETERYLLEEFGQDIDRIILQTGHGGIFTITVGGNTVWDKAVHGGDLDLDLIGDAVRNHMVTA